MDFHRHHRRSGGIRRDAHLRMHEREIVTSIETILVTESGVGQGKTIGFTTLSDSPPSTTPTFVQVKSTAKPTTKPFSSAAPIASPTPTPTPTPSPSTSTPLPTKPKSTVSPITDSPRPTSTPVFLPQTRPATSSTTSLTSSSTTSSSTTSSTTSEQTPTTSSTAEQETSSQTTFSTQISSSSASYTTPATSTVDDLLSPSGVLASQTAGPTLTSAVPVASGLSTVATVGMIAGACAIFLVLGAFAAFFYRRKAQKKMAAAYGKTEDEKSGVSGGSGGAGGVVYSEKLHSAPTVMYSEKAPRISVRPVTEFMPNLNGPPAAAAAAATVAATTTRQVTNTPNTGLSAAPSETRKAPPPALSLVTNEPTPSSPFTGNSEPSSLISPTGSGFIDVGAAAGAAALMNPVHRVQMDFKPSMGDELELRGGALVRLLHEYDDGWALCTRLDRSQQGVCPRTCLSQRPVKPRPQGAPDSPPQARVTNGRPQSPIVIRPYNAGPGSHPQSPITGPNRILGQPQRPQSPAMPRSPGLGYVKAQYRPASAQSPVQSHPGTPTHTAPQSPIGRASPPPSLRVGPPLITISTAPESGSSNNTPQSPVSAPSPIFAPIKPSPLSNQQTVSIPTAGTEERKEEAKTEAKTEEKTEKTGGEQLVFHAM